jgi:hypothetical protein
MEARWPPRGVARLPVGGPDRRWPVSSSGLGYLLDIEELRVRQTLPPEAASAATGRLVASRALTRWGLGATEATILLLVTELISNGVRHAKTTLTLVMSFDGERLRLGVSDRDDHLPEAEPEPARAHHGWGLRLVEMLSTDWGTCVDDGGKTVWCDVSVAAASPS